MIVRTKRRKGFSLIEILLSIALIAVLAALSVPVFRTFSVKNDLDIAGNAALHALRRAQALSQASDFDSSWGVRIGSTTITMFRGQTFASRIQSSDEPFDFSPTITPSGLGEIVFSKLYGDPNATGTIILTSSVNKVVKIIINGRGTADLTAADLGLPQADTLVVDASGASVGGTGSRRLLGIRIQNTALYPITIASMTVSWTGTRSIQGISIGGVLVWSSTGPGTPTGKQPSGTTLDIQDFALPASSGFIPVDYLEFDGNVSANVFTITFTMADGSSKTASGINQIALP